MDHDDDGETSYNTFVDDVAFEPTYSQALLTAAGRNIATLTLAVIIGSYRRGDVNFMRRNARRRFKTSALAWRPLTT